MTTDSKKNKNFKCQKLCATIT